MEALSSVFPTNRTLRLRGHLLDLSVPVVMGILNVTPDSFYAGSRLTQLDTLLKRAEQMLSEGAAILDVGGYSSRPGASDISETEELDRVLPAVEAILQAFPEAYISVDTFRANVAQAAVRAGACLVNDISGGSLDERMFETIGNLQVPYVLMHTRGNPQTMASLTHYDDLLVDLMRYFEQKIHLIRQFQIKDVILDVGFGFAKTIDQNYQLLRQLTYFRLLNLPMLAGISRKSMIYKRLHIPLEDAANGTTVLNTLALVNGASILRVHDVKEAAEAIKLFTLYND